MTILKVLNRVFGLENMSKTFWVFFKVHKWYHLQAEKTLNFSTYYILHSTNEGTLTLSSCCEFRNGLYLRYTFHDGAYTILNYPLVRI